MADQPNPRGGALRAGADTWALLSAAAVALVMMGLAFLRQVPIGHALIRSGLGFVITYAVVFLLVQFALRIALRELAAEAVERRHERQRRRKQEGGPDETGPGEDV